LVDSGSDRSLFSAALAPLLGLDLDDLARAAQARPTAARGVGGEETVFAVDVQLTVATIRFPARIHLSSRWDLRFGLLGRADLFRAFRVAFDERAETLYLDPYAVD
jgi:hypothetical protein